MVSDRFLVLISAPLAHPREVAGDVGAVAEEVEPVVAQPAVEQVAGPQHRHLPARRGLLVPPLVQTARLAVRCRHSEETKPPTRLLPAGQHLHGVVEEIRRLVPRRSSWRSPFRIRTPWFLQPIGTSC